MKKKCLQLKPNARSFHFKNARTLCSLIYAAIFFFPYSNRLTNSPEVSNWNFNQAAYVNSIDFLSGWVLDTVVSNVAFHHQIIKCAGKNVVFLKLNNKNDYKVRISWKEIFDTQNERQREGFTGQKTIVISPGETAQSNCEDNRCKECLILPTHVNPSYAVEILKFQFAEIQVSRAQNN